VDLIVFGIENDVPDGIIRKHNPTTPYERGAKPTTVRVVAAPREGLKNCQIAQQTMTMMSKLLMMPTTGMAKPGIGHRSGDPVVVVTANVTQD
jgi:hypothetical protein